MRATTFSPRAATVLALTIAACTDDARMMDPDDGSNVGPGEVADGNGSDAPPAQLTLPVEPAQFSVELSGTACFGDCPTYTVSIDQAGEVRFVGEQCVARPGVFTQRVAPEAARALYDAIVASPYPRLGDRYVTASDGCNVFTDAPTSRWRVRGDDQEKTLTRYHGCDGVDELLEVDALESLVRTQSAVEAWFRRPDFNCGYQLPKLPSQGRYRLERLGAPVALLTIESANGWSGNFSVRDCAGTETARGDVRPEHGRLVLLEAQRGEITLPEDLGSVGSLLIEGEKTGFNQPFVAQRARGLFVDSETEFQLVEAATCTPMTLP